MTTCEIHPLPRLWLRRTGSLWSCPSCNRVWRVELRCYGTDSFRVWHEVDWSAVTA